MSHKWPIVPLGHVLALDTNRVAVDPSATYPMVGVLSFGRGLFDREPIVNGNTSYRFFYRLDADHFVMSQLFGWEGALALSSPEYAGKYLSPQFPTFRCDAARLDRRFLGWVTRRPDFWDQLGKKASGMGDRRRTLTPDALLTSEIPLPTLSEQRRIVDRIEAIAGKVEEARRLRREAEQCVREVFDSALSREISDLHSCESSLGSAVLSYRNGLSRRPAGRESGPVVLRLADVSGGAISLANPRRGSLTRAEIEKYTLKSTDLVAVRVNGSLSIVGRVMAVGEQRETVCFNDHLIRIRLDSSMLDSEYAALACSSRKAREYIERVATTTAGQYTVNQGMISALPLPIPTLAVQRRVVDCAKRLQDHLSKITEQLTDGRNVLDALLPAVLDKACSGEM